MYSSFYHEVPSERLLSILVQIICVTSRSRADLLSELIEICNALHKFHKPNEKLCHRSKSPRAMSRSGRDSAKAGESCGA